MMIGVIYRKLSVCDPGC